MSDSSLFTLETYRARYRDSWGQGFEISLDLLPSVVEDDQLKDVTSSSESHGDSESDHDSLNSCEIDLQVYREITPRDSSVRYTLFVVDFGELFDQGRTVYRCDFGSKRTALCHLHKIYSQSARTLPFVKTGEDASYNDVGHYPPVPPHIRDMDHIELGDVQDDTYSISGSIVGMYIRDNATGNILVEEALQCY